MTVLVSIALLIWAAALALLVVGTALTLRKSITPPPHLDAPFALVPVSILKPLKGADNGLERNLEDFFRLDYPDYELIFSVASPRDPALPVVSRLIRRYPGIRARVIVGDVNIGPNPKVNNLIRSYDRARHDWILISDSNVRVKPDYLKRLVAHVDNDVGIVTSVVAGTRAQGIGGRLEAAYLNTFYSRGMHIAGMFGRGVVVGKSMLFRRSVADRFGGIRALAKYLAEDYMAGVGMIRLGLKVATASDPIDQYIGRYSFGEFWSRHLRWGRIRKTQAPLPFFIEPWLGSILSGALGAWAAGCLYRVPAEAFLAGHALIWASCDLLLLRRFSGRLTLRCLAGWALREAVSLALWLHIACGNTVNWRGQKLKLRTGGEIDIIAARA